MSDWLSLKNALNLTFRPIDVWPGKPYGQRERSPFSASLKDTLDTLKKELRALNAHSIVMQIAIRESDLRLDGLPRANAIASHPGVILSFTSKHGPLRIAFDRFVKWEHNLRAMAMHLEHLRLASLYGVGQEGEAYRGWRALPPPPAEKPVGSASFDSDISAAEWMAKESAMPHMAGVLLINQAQFRRCYHDLALKMHPDTGGSQEAFVRLQAAADRLRKRFET